MTISYEAGVAAGIVAGFAFNLGMVIQKAAVARIPKDGSLVRGLAHSPLWIAGVLTQFVIGTPLNLLAALRVGPAILPGLLATGLIVLAVGAVVIAHESPGAGDIVGILLIGGAIALFGLSRLAVDMSEYAVWEPAFLLRLAEFSGGIAATGVVAHLVLVRIHGLRPVARALDGGFLFTLSNLWIGIGVGMLRSLLEGEELASLPLTALTGGLAAVTSLLGVLETQRAFRVGDASRIVPIQQIPQQALPLVVYFAVFRLPPPTPASLPLAGGGIVLILVGAVLLARRQAAMQ